MKLEQEDYLTVIMALLLDNIAYKKENDLINSYVKDEFYPRYMKMLDKFADDGTFDNIETIWKFIQTDIAKHFTGIDYMDAHVLVDNGIFYGGIIEK